MIALTKTAGRSTYLYHWNLRFESSAQLLNHFLHQERVLECLTSLHRSDNGSLNDHLTILVDRSMQTLDVFLLDGFQWNIQIYLDLFTEMEKRTSGMFVQ